MINQTTAATLTSFGDFLNFQYCSGASNPSPFAVVLEGEKCVCCGEFAQTQLAGYWVHPDIVMIILAVGFVGFIIICALNDRKEKQP